MNKITFVLLVSMLFFASCSSDQEEIFEEDALETVETTPAKFYIPPGAIVNNVPVTFYGCVTYTLNVQTVKYGGAVTLSPDTSFLNNAGSNATVYIDVVPAPYGQTISTAITTSNQYVFVDSQYLSGRTSFYWRMRVVNTSSYNCWPNPTSWNFMSLN
jgi:hypothetical protein